MVIHVALDYSTLTMSAQRGAQAKAAPNYTLIERPPVSHLYFKREPPYES